MVAPRLLSVISPSSTKPKRPPSPNTSLGSALMGWLYDRSVLALVTFSVLAQVAAMVVFMVLARGHNRHLR